MGCGVLITGVAGMIGSHLTTLLLRNGYTVHGIDDLSVGTKNNIEEILENKNFQFSHSKLENFDWSNIDFTKFDYFIHLAAHKKIVEEQNVLPLFNINVECSTKIIELCTAKKLNLVFASTSDVYGHGTKIPFSENDDILLGTSTAKRWAYAVSKLYIEHLIQGYVKERDLKACIIRYFGGFSERSNFSWSGGHIPSFINALKNKSTIKIHGDGNQTRSIGHADDLANGTKLVIENFDKIIGEVINLGNDEEISINDSLKKIVELMGVEKDQLKVEYIPEDQIFGSYRDIRRRKPDLSKARLMVGYEPTISFEDSVSRVLRMINHQ